MKKWKAFVNRIPGKTTHPLGALIEGRVVPVEKFPDAAWVIIEETAGGFFLFRYSATAEYGGDTWHETFEDAKRQAEVEYEIGYADWEREDAG